MGNERYMKCLLSSAQVRPNHVTFGTAVGCCGSSWKMALGLLESDLFGNAKGWVGC